MIGAKVIIFVLRYVCLESLARTRPQDPWPFLFYPCRLFQPCTIRIGKEYLYGLHFAGLTYSLYGWLARVELHLVN